MSLTLTNIQDEVKARGFDYVTTTRLNYWINRAYNRICEADDWVWLRTTTSGTAPLTISDLRQIVTVVDLTDDRVLPHIPEKTVIDFDGDLTTTGTPECWYRTGETQISVYPANTSHTIAVTYLKVPTELSSGSDTPILPSRYHYLLVDAAVVEAYKDSDNLTEAQTLEQQVQALIQEMRQANSHAPDYQVSSGQNY